MSHLRRREPGDRRAPAFPIPCSGGCSVGSQQFDLEPLLDDQENDTRLSTGAIYWEGAVRAYQAHRLVGRGYLELTGYGQRLRLR